jgi:hypothetical protein
MDGVQKKIPKISTKIWQPIIQKLEEKMNAACLRRDAYLNKVLEIELPYLDREVSLANSAAAQSFLTQRLDQLDRKLVSLALRPDLIERLNDICTRKRIPRDAFFNRLFLLLAASAKVIDHLLFPAVGDRWRTEVWSEYKHEGPFFQNTFYPLEQDIDPFWAIRAGIEHYSELSELHDYTNPETGKVIHVQRDFIGNIAPENSIYTSLLTNKQIENADLYGLNCYIPDHHILGHPAELKYRKKLDEMLVL